MKEDKRISEYAMRYNVFKGSRVDVAVVMMIRISSRSSTLNIYTRTDLRNIQTYQAEIPPKAWQSPFQNSSFPV